MDIEWDALLVVASVTLAATILITIAYAGGVRLLATAGASSAVARVGAIACFALCAAAVLFGLWLIVPQLHA